MSQPPSLSNCRVALCERLVGIAETKQDNSEKCLGVYVGMDSGLVRKRAVGDQIIERKCIFGVLPR